jgi:mono/diheme cytochrome c family protein
MVMAKIFRPIALTMVLVVASACGGKSEGEDLESPRGPQVFEINDEVLARGQHTYKLNCVPCHGPLGKGDGPSAAGLNPKPRDHSNREYMARLTDEMIAETVKMGGVIRGYPNMPSSPHIKGEEMVGLVSFVRRLSDPERKQIELTLAKIN